MIGNLQEKGGGSRLFTDYKGRADSWLSMLIANRPQLMDLEKKTVDLHREWFVKLLQKYKETHDRSLCVLLDPKLDQEDFLQGSLFAFRNTMQMGGGGLLMRYIAYN